MARIVIICIGNVARGDDGAAHEVARLLDGRLPANAVVLSAPALDIAMAQEVAESGLLIVVDAERRSEPAVQVRPISAGPARAGAHSVDPPGLLSLAHALYDRHPVAWLVSVAAPDMPHATGLSAAAQAAAKQAADRVAAIAADASDSHANGSV